MIAPMFGSYSRGSAPDWRTMLNSHPLFQDTAPNPQDSEDDRVVGMFKDWVRNRAPQQQSDISPGWEGLVGAGEGLANAVPVVRSNVISPVEMAPAPNTTPGWVRGTGQLAGDITGGVLETVGGTAAGLPLGPVGAIAGAAGAAAYGSAAENAEQHRIDEMRRREQELGPQANPTQEQIDPGRWEGGWKQLDTGDAVEAALNAATAGLGTKLGLSGAQALRELVQSKAAPEVVRNLALREGGKQVAADIGMGAATSPVSVLNQQNVNPFTDPELAMQTLADNKGQLLWDTALNAAISGGGQLPTFARALRGGDQLIADTQALLEREKAIASQPKPQPIEERAPNKFMDAMSSLRQKTAELIGGKKLVPEEQLRQEVERRAEAERMADTDEMTGLANKNAFVRAKDSADADAKSSFATFDMNNFKAVNDIEGHEAGDKMLAAVGDALRAARDETNQNIRIFRTGGDEFTAIGPKATMQQFRDLAEARFGERGRYKTSLSGEVADTFSAADAGLKARKEARKKSLGVAQTREEMDALIEAEKRRMEGGDVLEEGQAGRQAEVLDVSGVDPGLAEINSSAAIQAGAAPEPILEAAMQPGRAPKGGKPKGDPTPDMFPEEPKMPKPKLTSVEPMAATLDDGNEIRPMDAVSITELAGALSDELKVSPKAHALKTGEMGSYSVGKDDEGTFRRIIKVSDMLGEDPQEFKKVLAHEAWHAYDLLPADAADRFSKQASNTGSNVLGKILNFTRFMKENEPTFFDHPKYSNETLTKEAKALSEFVRPTEGDESPAYKRYRAKPSELIADMGAALTMSPGHVKEIAPNLFKAFFENVNSRPAAKAAWDQIQAAINGPKDALLDQRLADLRGDYGRGNERLADQIKARTEGDTEGSFTWRQALLDMFDPVTKASQKQAKLFTDKGEPIPQSIDFEEKKQQMMRDTWGHRIASKVERGMKILTDAGATLENMGTVAQLERIILGDREKLLNPRGYTPAEAREVLAHLKKRLGPEKMEAVYKALNPIREASVENLRLMHELGRITDERYEALVAEGKENFYAPFKVLEHVKDDINPMLEQQKGTLKAAANPGTMLALKTVAQAKYLQKLDTQKTALNVMKESGDARPVERDAKDRVVKKPGLSTLLDWEGGQPVEYYVHPTVTRAFRDFRNLGANMDNVFWKTIKGLNQFQRAAMLTYNPVFIYWSQPIRDIANMYATLPKGTSLKDIWKTYRSVKKNEAKQYANGEPPPDVFQMIDDGVLEPTNRGLYSGTPLTPEGRIYKSLDLMEKNDPKGYAAALESKYVKPALDILKMIHEFAEKQSTISEVTPKIAANKILEKAGWSQRDRNFYIRNNEGTPNYGEKGFYTAPTNTVFQFSNVAIQGTRAFLRLLRNNPGAAGLKVASIAPRLAVSGSALALGTLLAQKAAEMANDEVREAYDHIPEYDQANYMTVWLGMWRKAEDGSRAPVYIRVPLPEQMRIVRAMAYNAFKGGLNEDSLPNLLASASQQTPSLTANLDIMAQWAKYASGGTPYDSFRDRPVVDKIDRDSGKALGKMLEWSVGQFGIPDYNVANLPERWANRVVKNVTQPERGAVSNALRAEVRASEKERNIKSGNARDVLEMAKKNPAAIDEAVRVGAITEDQAKRIRKELQQTSTDRVLSRLPKSRREELQPQYGAR